MRRMDDRKTAPLSARRMVSLAGALCLIFSAFAVRLFRVQVTEHEKWSELAQGYATLSLPVPAARGEILDRDLTPLVANTAAYAVVLDQSFFPATQDAQNAVIAALCALFSERDEEWNDTLPISDAAPYSFLPARENSVAALKKSLSLGEEATAEECMAALAARYDLGAYTAAQQRWLAGVRYEMAARNFNAVNPYTFAAAVAKETTYLISENTATFPGVVIQTTAVRDYVAGTVAAHLLGTVGPIYAEEYAQLKEQGYALNDTLGKSGAEAAFEPYLRGVAGRRVLQKGPDGAITDVREEAAPVPGDTVVLTLDAALQQAAQQALDKTITDLRTRPATSGGKFLNNGHDATSGAVVVLDVADGGVLTAASWPSYDLATYRERYTELLEDPDRPLFNRALNGVFACGSTMKPGVALAALTEGAVTPTTTFSCRRRYDRFAAGGLILHCMGYHGRMRVTDALERSCNVFFYETALALGIENMNRYSSAFGLGVKTGVEIGEAAGVLAGPAYRASVGRTWTAGDTAGAAIGQSDNLFTPIQLAAYAMTIANGGVRYATHLLHSRRSYDGRVKEAYVPQVAEIVGLSAEAMDTVHEGMVAVATSGTAASYFRRAPYTLACKTGTAQVSAARSDHGVFIAYAPAEDPQVAVAVVVENGTSQAACAVAREVLDAYFTADGEATSP